MQRWAALITFLFMLTGIRYTTCMNESKNVAQPADLKICHLEQLDRNIMSHLIGFLDSQAVTRLAQTSQRINATLATPTTFMQVLDKAFCKYLSAQINILKEAQKSIDSAKVMLPVLHNNRAQIFNSPHYGNPRYLQPRDLTFEIERIEGQEQEEKERHQKSLAAIIIALKMINKYKVTDSLPESYKGLLKTLLRNAKENETQIVNTIAAFGSLEEFTKP